MDKFNSILSDFFWCGRFANIKPIVDSLKISYAIVKGEVLSKQIYGKTGERICSDIDFLVPRSCLKIVENKLVDNGFSCVSIKRSDAVTWLVLSHQTPPRIKKDRLYGDIVVDLNFDIFWGEYTGARISIEEFLSDTVEIDVHGVKVKALPIPKAFIQLILHHYKEMNSIYIVFGYYTIASFTAMFNACNNFRSNVRNFVDVFAQFKDHKLYADKVYSFLDYKPSTEAETGISKDFNERIELRGVSYIYPNTAIRALNNVNLTIKKGEKIAIVGRNGAGKSTLIKIIMRLYQPSEGLVAMDGVPYQDIKESAIIKTFSCCFQDFSLYSFSLGENVSMSNEYDVVAIRALLEKVNMSGYSPFIASQVNRDFDEEGLNFSGGEAQRIGIIRAIYQNSEVLIFDEANSSLDPIAEKELNDLIYDISGDKTTIFISHRLSTATKADRIIYMEGGSIVECGTHRELLQQNGKYATLYKAQVEQLMEKS